MTDTTDHEWLQLQKEYNRLRMGEIWQKGKRGEPQTGEEARLVKIMGLHHSYIDIWDHLDELTDEEIERDGVNPVLHAQFHLVVENQIAEKNPKEVGSIVKELTGKGYTRHEAIHAIANVLVIEMFNMLKEQKPYNEARYLRELRKIPKK